MVCGRDKRGREEDEGRGSDDEREEGQREGRGRGRTGQGRAGQGGGGGREGDRHRQARSQAAHPRSLEVRGFLRPRALARPPSRYADPPHAVVFPAIATARSVRVAVERSVEGRAPCRPHPGSV